jgi:gamma-glutamylcyclotransferase (GGCT)/AIG2-like uncharacterized protein YtfP
MPLSVKLRLFQYGSNMSVARMRGKIEEHRQLAPTGSDLSVSLLGPARLPGFRFVFDLYSARQQCRVSDVIEGDESDEVWGVVYELDRELVQRSDGRRSVLDRIEGHRTTTDPENYRPIEVTVLVDETPVTALTYVGADDARRRCVTDHPEAQVAPAYLEPILSGAAEARLPGGYLNVIKSAAGGPHDA